MLRRRSLSRVLAVVLLLTVLVGTAAAQSLARLAPDASVLALTIRGNDVDMDALLGELAALDWEGAAATLETLGGALADDLDLGSLGRLGPLGGMGGVGGMVDDATRGLGDGMGDALGELADACPAAVDAMPADPSSLLDDGLLTIAVSPFNPMPVVTALARPADLGAATTLQSALVSCLGSDVSFEQDGIPLWLLGDGGEFPLIVGTVGDVVFASTNPDVARGIVRRAMGSDEPSLADTRLWQARDAFEARGLGITLDLSAIADLVQGFVPRQDPELSALVDRGVAVLRTLGGVSAEIGIDADGLALGSVVAVDPAGGDADLADLILCPTCTLSAPFLAPRDAVSVSSERLPIRAFIDYLDGVLADLGTAADGVPGVRDAFAMETGEDLDTVLLGWIGDEIHTVRLAPFEPDLDTLIFGAPQAVTIPVTSAEDAEAGLDAFGRLLAPFENELGAMFAFGPGAGAGLMGGIGGAAGGADMAELGDLAGIAVRPMSYRGIELRRIQIGFGFDVAVGVVGSQLVVASPSRAAEPIIDTYLGAPSFIETPAYRALAATPGTVQQRSWSNPAPSLAGVASMADTLSQPVAAAARAALLTVPVSRETSPMGEDPFGAESMGLVPTDGYAYETGGSSAATPFPQYDLDPGTDAAPRLAQGVTRDALQAEETRPDGDIADYYELGALPSDVQVRIVVTSDAFDTFLRLYLPGEGMVGLQNDDAPDTTRSELLFVPEPGVTYWVEVSSFFGTSTGPYELEYSLEPLAAGSTTLADTADAPRFTNGTLRGRVSDANVLPNGDLGTFYDIGDVPEGARVQVVVTSEDFDTYLRLVDPDAELVLLENDDAPDTSRSELAFTSSGDRRYWVELSSFGGGSTGAYEITVAVTTPEAESMPADDTGDDAPTQPPSFAEFLGLTELTGQTLGIVADHVGTVTSTRTVLDGVVVNRSRIHIRW